MIRRFTDEHITFNLSKYLSINFPLELFFFWKTTVVSPMVTMIDHTVFLTRFQKPILMLALEGALYPVRQWLTVGIIHLLFHKPP